MRRLAAVVEAEGPAARLAEEGQEVELVAVGELAVFAHEAGVVAYAAAVDFGHFDVACFRVGCHLGRWEGWAQGN